MSKTKTPDPRDVLASLRARVVELKAEIARADHAPAPLSEVEARIALAIERVANDWRADAMLTQFTAPTPGRAPIGFAETINPPPAVVAPAALKAALLAEAKAEIERHGGSGLPMHERPAERERLVAELLAVEQDEERAFLACERAGYAVERRGDADPAAVLSVAE